MFALLVYRMIYSCIINDHANKPVIMTSSGTAKQVCFTLSNYQVRQPLVYLPIPGTST